MPGSDDANIGDFSRPIAPKPAQGAGTSKTASELMASGATREALVSAETRLDEEASRDEAALKPMSSYEDKLKAAGLTKAEASEIVDAVLFKGFWAKDVKITSRVSARFRTRNARDSRRAAEMLEAQRWTLDSHYTEAMSRLILAASLEQFGSDKLLHVDPRKAKPEDVEKAFVERLAFVEGLADPALRLLLGKLWKFDNLVTVALEEGTVENF